jgi:hypothetical protein
MNGPDLRHEIDRRWRSLRRTLRAIAPVILLGELWAIGMVIDVGCGSEALIRYHGSRF